MASAIFGFLTAVIVFIGGIFSPTIKDIINPPKEVCSLQPLCEEECIRTCDNPCSCDIDNAKVNYGEKCFKDKICREDITNPDDCVNNNGDFEGCPKMISVNEALEKFTTFDYRLDIRVLENTKEAANVSKVFPDMYKKYKNELDGLEDKNLFVYCKKGNRSLDASINLLKYGFRSITWMYGGGYEDLRSLILSDKDSTPQDPSKARCYDSGETNACPQPLPLGQVKNAATIAALGKKVTIVDARPEDAFPKSFDNAHRVVNDDDAIKKLFAKLDKDTVIVYFCQKGVLSFRAAKSVKRLGWKARVFWIDNGGFPELEKITGMTYL